MLSNILQLLPFLLTLVLYSHAHHNEKHKKALITKETKSNLIIKRSKDGTDGWKDFHIGPPIRFDDLNIPKFDYSKYKYAIDKVACIAKAGGDYVNQLVACFSDIDTLIKIKTESRDFLWDETESHHRPEDWTLDLHRCFGSMAVSEDKPEYLESSQTRFRECLIHYNIQNFTEEFVKVHLSKKDLSEWNEFLTCLSKSYGDNIAQVSKECVQVNLILFKLAFYVKNPFPYHMKLHQQDHRVWRNFNSQTLTLSSSKETKKKLLLKLSGTIQIDDNKKSAPHDLHFKAHKIKNKLVA